MAQQVLEGTWEEIAAHAEELAGKRLTVIVETTTQEKKDLETNIPVVGPPNEKMLTILQEIAERQKSRRETLGDSVEIVRYGRSGSRYGMPFVDDLWIQPGEDDHNQ